MRYHFIPVRMPIIKKSTNSKCWVGCGEKGTLLHCWWECKLVQPLLRTVRRFLKKWKMELPSVQFSRAVMSDSLWPHPLQQARQASLSITNSQSLPKLMSIESVMPSNHLILCHPVLFPPSIFPSIRATISSNSTPGYISRENHNLKRHMHPNVHSSTICNSWDMEAT